MIMRSEQIVAGNAFNDNRFDVFFSNGPGRMTFRDHVVLYCVLSDHKAIISNGHQET